MTKFDMVKRFQVIFVRRVGNVVVRVHIPKFDAKPNPTPNPNTNLILTLLLTLTQT